MCNSLFMLHPATVVKADVISEKGRKLDEDPVRKSASSFPKLYVSGGPHEWIF